MKFLISLLEESLRAERGSLTPEQLATLDERIKVSLEAGASAEGANVAYLAGILLEIGLDSTARLVVAQATRQAASAFEYSSLENLQGRLAFESRNYESALSHFNEAFQAATRDYGIRVNARPSSAAIRLQYCVAFNIAVTYKRRQDLEGAKEWRQHVTEIQSHLDSDTASTAAVSMALYWWDLALGDFTPTEDTLSRLREKVAIILNDLGPHHRDSRYCLMTLASASFELALTNGNLAIAEDFANLMEAMCQREAGFVGDAVFGKWMQLVSLSSYAEISIARGRWDFLGEVAGQLENLLRGWPTDREDSATLFEVLELNLAMIGVELARETTQPRSLLDAVRLLHLAIENAGQCLNPLDPRISTAVTSHVLALVDALWGDPNMAMYGLSDKIEDAKALAVACLGEEHPGTVILIRQLQALVADSASDEGRLEASRVSTMTRVEAGTVTGYFSRDGYVAWSRAAQSIRQEARSSSVGISEVTWLTQDAYDRLNAELDYLSGAGRLEIAKKIEAAREEGDLRETGGYHDAKEQQGKQEARIRQLQHILDNSRVGEPPRIDGVVGPGMTVTIRFQGDEDEVTFLLASREESGSPIDVYSPRSPLGNAINGRSVGETATYTLPNGRAATVEIVEAVPYGEM